jgi:hypothetical protein
VQPLLCLYRAQSALKAKPSLAGYGSVRFADEKEPLIHAAFGPQISETTSA